jgi:hypothetical protein
MAQHIRKMFAFTDPEGASNGDEFVECNLEQLEPDTAILSGKTGLTFTRCRLVNCSLPGDAVITGGIHPQIDFCTNLHPERINKGQTPCAENCSHVVDADEIYEGDPPTLVETIYYYEDTVQ